MRKTLRILTVVVVFLLLLAAGAFFHLRRSLPQVEGEIVLAGLEAPVEILRDPHGVPHIFARSMSDASFALGFVHAQDRLWQMETSRRLASGRVAELAGPAALPVDRMMRTLGLRRVAAENLRRYNAETRQLLGAYAAGVNAFLATKPVLPPEFLLSGIEPEPWSTLDSVVWTKVMALDLGGNWRNELLRMHLSRSLPMERVRQFLPPYPGDEPLKIRDLRSLYEGIGMPLTPGWPPGASNSWAVSGARSASGKPLLANDPHLRLTTPPVWYFAHLSTPGVDVIGATLPGVPGVVIGHNQRIAWGFTNTGTDVQDLYLEKVLADGRYATPAGPREFKLVRERIRVKGQPEEELLVRISRHGPVISHESSGHALALAWTALQDDDVTGQAIFRVAGARDWKSFLAATRDYYAPMQTISYADVDGNIGYASIGRVPVRKPGNDLRGLVPAPGWDARYDWTGWIPFDQLPRVLNPRDGMVVNANHKTNPPGYRQFITSEWQPPYRANRIAELLAATPKHTLQTFARMQMDVLSPVVREALPRLLATQAKSDRARDALQRLAAWDATMAADRAEPLIAIAWWREISRGLYADELGSAFRATWGMRAQFVSNALNGRGGAERWCDDTRTERIESCDDVLADALERALDDLARRYGSNPDRWRWGEAHFAWSVHRPFSRVPWLAPFFEIRVPVPGDAYTLNVGQTDFNDEAEPYASRHAPSLRAIYDLADLEASVFVHSAGQSGNPLSRHYRDLSRLWARGEYVPMLTQRKRIEALGAQRLVLAPPR